MCAVLSLGSLVSLHGIYNSLAYTSSQVRGRLLSLHSGTTMGDGTFHVRRLVFGVFGGASRDFYLACVYKFASLGTALELVFGSDMGKKGAFPVHCVQ